MNLTEIHHSRLKVWIWHDDNGKAVAKYRKIPNTGTGMLTFRDRSPWRSRPFARPGRNVGSIANVEVTTNAKAVATVAEARKIVAEIVATTQPGFMA